MNRDSSDYYSLQDSNNYKEAVLHSVEDIFKIYVNLLNCYIEHYVTSTHTDSFYIKNTPFYYYLLEKGVSTINHVFTILLLYTKNIDLADYYCKKIIYYYIEFIGQNSKQSEKKLDYNNASLFSYSKTIYNLNKLYAKNSIDSEICRFASIDKMVLLYQIILNRHLIKNNAGLINNEKDKYLLIDYVNTINKKCSNYILNMLSSKEETYIIVKYISLEEMYDCKRSE